MSIRSDVKSVFEELSPILAGFKLSLIIISYFGLGSVAKWVVSHWYPFTRWVWDFFCEYFTLPIFPVVVKDSLTALVFFIPLGLSAASAFFKNVGDESQPLHKLMGAFFGFLFLVVICKDALSSIAKSVKFVEKELKQETVLTRIFNEVSSVSDSIPGGLWWPLLLSYMALCCVLAFFSTRSQNQRKFLEGYFKVMSKFLMVLFSVGFLVSILTGMQIVRNNIYAELGIDALTALAIMFMILTILGAAITYAPRKLFITTGACIAFVAAAACFELLVLAIDFIERAPAPA